MDLRQTQFTTRLGLKHPLVVAPMAGGPTTIELVAAASNAGALGSYGAAYTEPEEMIAFAEGVSRLTDQPFAVNLFIPHTAPNLSQQVLETAIKATAPYRRELRISEPHIAPPFEIDFNRQFEAVLRIRPAAFSFIFGLLQPEYVRAAKKENILLVGTASSPGEAKMLEETGVDMIVLQGVQAGGHRAIFDPDAVDPQITTLKLLLQVQKTAKLPLVAAGGVMNRADIAEMLAAGASAVQMGTAFLATREAGTALPYRQRLLESPQRSTRLTRAFSGRIARGIENRFLLEMDTQAEAILPFPIQNCFTRDIRAASAKQGLSDYLSLWCGTGFGDLYTGSAADLICDLFPQQP